MTGIFYYIDGLECGDLVAELKDKIAGSYVVFAKPESVFPKIQCRDQTLLLRKKTEMLS